MVFIEIRRPKKRLEEGWVWGILAKDRFHVLQREEAVN